MSGVVVVGVAGVGVGVGCEGFEVEFAGGGEDAGCYFASGSAVSRWDSDRKAVLLRSSGGVRSC